MMTSSKEDLKSNTDTAGLEDVKNSKLISSEEPKETELVPEQHSIDPQPADEEAGKFDSKSDEEIVSIAKAASATEKHAEAVEAYSYLIERKVAELGGDALHPSLAEIYVLYGKSCYQNANSNVGVLGESLLKKAEAQMEAQNAVASTSIEMQKAGKIVVEEESDDDDWEEDGEEVGEDEVLEDFSLAWELIETARLIYSKLDGRENELKLAEVHQFLGDMLCDETKFENAIVDYQTNLGIKQKLFPPHDRYVSEAEYMLALAYEGAGKLPEALKQFERACDSLKLRVKMLESRLSGKPADDGHGKGKEVASIDIKEDQAQEDLDSLKELIPDLEMKIGEISKSIIVSSSKASEGQSSKSIAPGPSVNDLSGLVKKRKRDPKDI